LVGVVPGTHDIGARPDLSTRFGATSFDAFDNRGRHVGDRSEIGPRLLSSTRATVASAFRRGRDEPPQMYS